MSYDNLDDALERWSVIPPDETRGNDVTAWYAVANDDGIVAYFGTEADALSFRLFMANLVLNHEVKR